MNKNPNVFIHYALLVIYSVYICTYIHAILSKCVCTCFTIAAAT